MARTVVTIEVEFDPEKVDADAVASALEDVLSEAYDGAEPESDWGEPAVSEFTVWPESQWTQLQELSAKEPS